MDTRHTKRSKISQTNDNDNPESRWKGSLPTEDLSDFGDEIWEGIVPQKLQKPTPEFEKKDDYPFGSTRSNVKKEYTASRVTFTLGPVFFKPASLRQDELHPKNTNPQASDEFQWERNQKPSPKSVEQIKNIEPFQNKRFLRCS